jgi:hypothetical protein
MSLTRAINDQVSEMIQMVLNEGEWNDDHCETYLSISIPNWAEEHNLDEETLLKLVLIEIKSEIDNYAMPWTCVHQHTADKDELESMGDEDHYLQFEFFMTR